jgi:hypothetical protein
MKSNEKQAIQEHGAVIQAGTEPQPERMKIDLHAHTQYSWDCATLITKIPERLIDQKIIFQAITDHNSMEGALALRDLVERSYPQVHIIVGEEVMTSEGEIIGLFLEKHIQPGLSAQETIEEIRKQDGLVLLPHGFDPMKAFRLRASVREELSDQLDIIETFNARVNADRWNRAAFQFAHSHGLAMSAGSDAHTLRDLGTAWVEVPYLNIRTPQDLLLALQNGVPVGRRVHPGISLAYRLFTLTKNKFKSLFAQ